MGPRRRRVALPRLTDSASQRLADNAERWSDLLATELLQELPEFPAKQWTRAASLSDATVADRRARLAAWLGAVAALPQAGFDEGIPSFCLPNSRLYGEPI